jgi:hypothetical protein
MTQPAAVRASSGGDASQQAAPYDPPRRRPGRPGQEYLVLEPSPAAAAFTVLLEPGTYAAEWFGIEGRERVPGAVTTVEGSMGASFRAPPEASGPTVLHVQRVDR